MGQDAALQIVVKLTLHISGQAFGSGIGIERGEKGFKMFRRGEGRQRVRAVLAAAAAARFPPQAYWDRPLALQIV